MIAVTRRTFRRFRAACARCVVSRTHGPAPPVVIRQAKGRVTLTTTFPDVTLELACGTTSAESEVLVVPMVALDELGSTSVELVELESTGALKGRARWPEGVRTKTHAIELIVPGKQHDPLPRPQEMKPVPARLLEALHEAGRTCSRDDGRFALSRIQMKGAKGEVLATDGKVATIFTGFNFPFVEDVLVPALPLFGCPELRDEREVRIGRTKTHVVVSVGDWTAWLVIATSAKYPDVTGVVPRQVPTRVALDRADAARLLAELPRVPGMDHENRPVTLDANGCLAVLGYDETTKATKGLELPACLVTGPPARAVLDRRVLARILSLGCDTLRLTPDKPLVATGPNVTILAAQLEPALAVPEVPVSGPVKIQSPQPRSTPEPERSTAMKPHDTNGTGNGRREPNNDEPPDPLTAAEELRDALSDVLAKATRLIAALRATRREKKVLATVFNGLKQLNLQPRNGGSSS